MDSFKSGDIVVDEKGSVVMLTATDLQNWDGGSNVWTYHMGTVLESKYNSPENRWNGKKARPATLNGKPLHVSTVLDILRKAGVKFDVYETPDSELSEVEVLKKRLAALESK